MEINFVYEKKYKTLYFVVRTSIFYLSSLDICFLR